MTGFSKQVRALVYERSGGVCEQCGLRSVNVQYHHRRPRGMGGSRAKDTNSASNCVLVCEQCHRFIESYRHEFLERGWLVAQGKSPGETPIWRHSHWVLLDDHGCVIPVKDIQEVKAPTGTSEAATVRRLRKDRPDLHAQYLANEISANAAAILAGFRPKTFTVRADKPDSIVATLRRQLDPQVLSIVAKLLSEGE